MTDTAGPRSGGSRLVAAAGLAVGLCLTVVVAIEVVFHTRGSSLSDEDCDDCGLTVLLDNIGWLALAIGGYLVVAIAVWILLRRPRR